MKWHVTDETPGLQFHVVKPASLPCEEYNNNHHRFTTIIQVNLQASVPSVL